MKEKTKLYLIAAVFIAGFLILAQGNVESILFDQIPYNYISYISLPANSPDEDSIEGFYQIYGKGRHFNFHIELPGAEDLESPLDYTKEGLNGTGMINNIHITSDTIVALLSGNFKSAFFNTRFEGVFQMTCAAWTGYGNFSNDGQNFPGNFKIDGQMTDWEGTFNISQEGDRIAIKSDYIYYPHANKSPDNIKRVQKTFYM